MTCGAIDCCWNCPFSTHILTRRMTFTHMWATYVIIFSTHILTRRMTLNCCKSFLAEAFSTHILTRRMTNLNSLSTIGLPFQLTSSQGGWLILRWYAVHCVHFSTHILTRRMTIHVLNFSHSSSFSTHILTRRMTKATGCDYIDSTFQLTSSQGGWQQF